MLDFLVGKLKWGIIAPPRPPPQWLHAFMSLKLLDHTSIHFCRNSSEKMQQGVNNHSMGMRSYLLKNNFKCNLQKHHFVYVYEIIIKCYLNFITCLYFPRALIRWHSSHCHLMELFKSKESFKEKFDSSNNWKTTWSRMILEWHLFLRLLLGFAWKILSFVKKHKSFYPKDVCVFFVFFI